MDWEKSLNRLKSLGGSTAVHGRTPAGARMSRGFTNAPRWLMLAALVFAPWAYGTTRPWAITCLNWLLGVAFLLWLLDHLLHQTRPAIPLLLAVPAIGLAAQAWFMVWNAKYDYDPAAHEFIPLAPFLEWAPGSLDRSLSLQSALQVSAILASILVICDLARRSTWRKRLLWTMALTGVSVALLGLAQKFTGARSVFWGPEDMGKTFFATWRNHTNAGAFLNLVWPLMAGFAALAFLRESAGWKKIFWTAAVVLCLAALVVNTSRAACALGLFLTALWLGWGGWQLRHGRFGSVHPIAAAIAVGLAVALVAAIAILTGLDSSLFRWRKFDRELTENNTRLLAAKVCLQMVSEAGWWGFGPGTFATAFPYFTHETGNQLRGQWNYAHQDYLQTLTEWGYVGSAGWAMLVLGGIIASMKRAARYRGRLSDSARVTHFAVLVALLGVLLHALVDFPLQIASLQLYVAGLLGLLGSGETWLRSKRPVGESSASVAATGRIARRTVGASAVNAILLQSDRSH
jgi:hypothetical protein